MSHPSREQPDSSVVGAIAELGIEIGFEFPKPLTDEVVRAADVVVTLGCGDACPVLAGPRNLDWPVPDPAGQDLDGLIRAPERCPVA